MGELNVPASSPSSVGLGWCRPRSPHHRDAHRQRQTHRQPLSLRPQSPWRPAASSASALYIDVLLISISTPPSISLRSVNGLKVRHGSGAGSPPRDELHLRAGSFSWLVTFQQSNYHCRMRNSLINYYCQAGLCAMIIPSEANFLNIWKQKYYYN